MEGKIYIAIGSNLGDRQKNVRTAYRLIEKQIGEIRSKSGLIHTKPEGFESDEEFVNGVFELDTKLTPLDLLKALKRIESEMGRESSSKPGYSDRLIDLDIIDYKGKIISMDEMEIPHPRMHNRMFVLKPLMELDSEWVHPIYELSVLELIDRFVLNPAEDF